MKLQHKRIGLIALVVIVILGILIWGLPERVPSPLRTAAPGSGVITLYDQVISFPGCSLRGTNSCATLDKTERSTLERTIRIERFVSGSGYLTVYFVERSGLGEGHRGGFTLDQAFFVPSFGEKVTVGTGLQTFERGNLVVEFLQSYTDIERLAVEVEFVFYYLPHTEQERQGFLFRLQDNPQAFFDFKEQNKRITDPLCKALKGQSRIPAGCPEAAPTGGQARLAEGQARLPDGQAVPSTGTSFLTTPGILPELDFSGRPTRRPIVTIKAADRLTFLNEPVTIKVDQVYDPDGTCQIFKFQWQKPQEMEVKDVSIDPRLGDLFFVPQNTGVFIFRFIAKEACKELGTLSSEPTAVRVVVNDKDLAFPDLAEAPEFQNAMVQLYHLGVMKGYPDGTMRPNAPINRAEFLKIIFETLQYIIDKTTFSPRYPDVLPDQWFAPYVHKADSIGVTKGYPDGRFHPEWTVNLVEALKMVMQFSTIEILDTTLYTFKDVSNEDWFSRYVQTAYREGILELPSGEQPGGFVFPGQLLTRGKAALIVVRTLIFPVNRINYSDTNVLRRTEEFEDFSSFN